MIKLSIDNKLKKLRIKRGLTQQTVADALGISRSVYSQYENNEREPSLRRIISISRFFMVSLDYLCSNDARIQVDITDLDDIQKARIYAIIKENKLQEIEK